MNKDLLYWIPAGQYGKEGVLSLLAQHPEIRFVSLIGIDLAGNDTDEKIPIEIFMKDYDDFFAGKAVQTDGSSVVFMNIATLNDARVDFVADSTVNWYVDYNDENVDDAVQHAERLMHYARIQKNTVITERQPEPHALQPTHSRQSVLIVDDSAMNRMLLSQMLNSQFDTAEAASGEDCLRLLEQNPTGISVVLLDIHMTGIDGFTVLEAMSQRGMLEEIPVIMISSEDNVDTVRRAFDLGASDYISRPFDARVVYQRITNTIRMYAKQRRLSAMVADQVSQKEKRSQMMIGILSRVVERRNGESRTHVQHISTLTGMLLDHLVQKTETYPLTQEMRRTISMASVLHDIGKMEIGEQVLNSPEPRTPEDEETMRQHTLLGARMLEELDAYRDEDFVRVAYQICRWHHERYDGSGYPDQLVGEQIPIAAQVVGLADAYETLTTGSGSQPPVPCAAAVQMLCTGEAGAFNPVLLDCLREIENEIDDAMRRRPETL